MTIDAHLHWIPGRPDNNPEDLINSGKIKSGWILSVHDLATGFAKDEEIIELCQKYPDFLIPFGYLDFDEASPERIDFLYKEGCIGLKAIWPEKAYDDPEHFPYYEKANNLGMPIVFHVGGAPYWPPERTRVPGKRQYSKNMTAMTIDAVAKTFPELTIIMAHMGGGDFDPWANQVAHGNPNVHMDLSAVDEETVKKAVKRVGAHKILFGSDGETLNGIAKAESWICFFKYYERSEKSMKELLGEGQFKMYQENIDKPRKLIMGENAERIIEKACAKRKDGGG